jgi:hypothetical protein
MKNEINILFNKLVLILCICTFHFTLFTFFIGAADAAWWDMPTICKINPSNCYSSMGNGFDSGMWDASANCWGLKLVCADALINSGGSDPVAMSKSDIAANRGIGTDFDTSVLVDGECFGARKTTSGGSKAQVAGKYENVWCSGVISDYDQEVAGGVIKTGPQPLCKDLAPDGIVAVLNGNCYGKSYNPNEYYIECAGNDELPKRLVVLAGARDPIIDTIAPSNMSPATDSDAKNLFDTMQSVSAAKKAEHFK